MKLYILLSFILLFISSDVFAENKNIINVNDPYYIQLVDHIRKNWKPATIDKNLQAVVFIKIDKDGNITNSTLEKTSGNTEFDQSALDAVSKSSPVPKPPKEMEIGIRFYP